jgi:sarcosine oxidase, subunit delta
MKQIDCPYIGLRPAAEFVYGGVWRPMPAPDECDDDEWGRYVFHRDGAPGLKRELWYHGPSGTWMVAERDTLTDRFVRTVTLAAALAEGAPDA